MPDIAGISSAQQTGMLLPVKQTQGTGSASKSVGEESTRGPLGNRSATVQQSIFIHQQMPDPLPPALGSKEILPKSEINQRSATVKKSVLYLKQIPDPLPPALGSTEILVKSEINQRPATVKRDPFILESIPRPLPSNIGVEDLPGGFRKEAVMNGRYSPTNDLVKGVVQIDDIKVMFNAWA